MQEDNDLDTDQLPLPQVEQSLNQLEGAHCSDLAEAEGGAVEAETDGSASNAKEKAANTVDAKEDSSEAFIAVLSGDQRADCPAVHTAQVEEVERSAQDTAVLEIAETMAQEVVETMAHEVAKTMAQEVAEMNVQDVAVQEVDLKAVSETAHVVPVPAVETQSSEVAMQEVEVRAQEAAMQEVADTETQEGAVPVLQPSAPVLQTSAAAVLYPSLSES